MLLPLTRRTSDEHLALLHRGGRIVSNNSLDFWARRRADRTGCTIAQAYEMEVLVAEEYDAERYDEDGPDNDDWIHEAYLRQAVLNDRDWDEEL